jgi:hypothetical protein
MNRVLFSMAGLVGVLLLLPGTSRAQSSIAGVVKDQSGAVIAGAKVSASSEAIIEGTKTATTNGEGRYEIVDLRPGTYVVSTTEAGFSTVKQTIILGANQTAPVDATLVPGSVGETVTVEARVTTVDVENAGHNTTLSRDDLDALPTGRYMQSIASYAPGAHLNLPDIGGSQQIEQNYIALHGNSSTQDVYVFDNMLINTTYSDGQIQQYVDNAAVQETTLQSSGITAETSGGGMMQNMVPRDGGNQFHSTAFLSGSNGTGIWQANNLNATTLARNLSQQDKIVKIEDFDGVFSGPIIKNKLWFTLTGRDQQTVTQAGNSVYPNGAPGLQDGLIYAGTFRLTYQMNEKNKFSAEFMRNWKYKGHEILDGGAIFPYNPAVSAKTRNKWPMYYILQGKWTYTATAKLLLQTGFSISHLDYNDLYEPGVGVPSGVYTGTAQIDTAYAGNGTGIAFTAGGVEQHYQTTRNFYSEQAVYITGNHQIKAGFTFSNGRTDYAYNANGDAYENFISGVPQSITIYNTPFSNNQHLKDDIGIYGMDTWKFKRLSVTAGLRWEYLAANIDPENAPAGRFAPARTIPYTDCSTIKGMGCWKDWAPRLAAVYDVFGNHKTAIKASIGKFNNQYASGFISNFNPMTASTETVTAWNWQGLGAACTPVNYPNLGPGPNPLCHSVGGFAPQGTATSALCAGCIGPSPNPTFGAVNGVGNGINLDPNWHRDYSWQYSAGVQQEVFRGTTLNVNYFRRAGYQSTLLVNENAIPISSWVPFQINNPLTGTPVTIFNLAPTVTALPTAVFHQTNNPQSMVRDVYQGFEFQGSARLRKGIFATFGYTLERQLARNCALNVTTSTPLQNPNYLRFCDWFGDSSLTFQGINVSQLGAVAPPWANNFVGNAVIPIKWGVVGALSFLSNNYQGSYTAATAASGASTIAANDGYLPRTIAISSRTASVYPNGCVGCQTALGTGQTCVSNPVTIGCPIDPGYNSLQGSTTVQLVGPGAARTPRLNQLDISVKRTFKFKEKYTFEPTFQLFNLLNSNAAITQTTSLPASTTGTGTAPFLQSSQCSAAGFTGAAAAQCGLGGNISTITTPRLMKLALIVRF